MVRKKKRILTVLLLILSALAVQIYQPVLAMEFNNYTETQSDPEVIACPEESLIEEVQEENAVDGISEAENLAEDSVAADSISGAAAEEAVADNETVAYDATSADDATENVVSEEILNDNRLESVEKRQDKFYAPAIENLVFSPMRQRALDPYVITNDADTTESYAFTSFSDLQAKITDLAANNKAYTITLNKDLVVTGDASLTFTGTSTWTVVGNGNTVKKEETAPVSLNRVIKIGEPGSSTTVTLKNVVVDGAKTYRVCMLTSGILTLDTEAIIQNGYSASEDISAGVHMGNDTTLNMKPGSKISGNISETGSYHGGAIKMARNCVVDIDGAVISGNSAKYNGGAIYADRGATSLTIKNTTFSGNKADSGGAIHTAVSTEIKNCTFENNASIGNGGAIYTNLNATETNSLTIEDTTFSENKAGSSGAQRDGGAIYSMTNTDIKGGKFEKNTATREGGAVFTPPSSTGTKDLLINGTTFSENEAKDGGAIYSSAKITISNASFQENKANKDGGGIYAYKSEAVKIDNTTFQKNHALGTATPGTRGDGGAIYAHKDTKSLSITETNFSENTSKYGGGAVSSNTATTIEGGEFKNNSAGASGGAIVMDSDYTLEINNVILSGNSAAINGGAICVDRAQSLNITKTTFSENTATLQGGAIHSKISTSIKGGKFELNSAKSGGAFHTGSYLVSLDISPFINADNTTEKTSFGENTAEYGGAIYSSANTTINQVTFQKNIANTDGGGIYASEKAKVEIYGTTFQENTAKNNGGAIFTHKNATSLTIEKTVFTQNKAAKGGAIFTRADTTIKNNTSFSENEASGEGGAIYTFSYSYKDPADESKYANLTIDATTSFENNKASYPYQPPINYVSYNDLQFSSTSFTDQENPYSGKDILLNDSLLNNNDINYKNSPYNTLCQVRYAFEDADGGTLPQAVQNLLPADSQAGIGSIVIPASPTATMVELVNGTWKFQNWDKTQVNIPQAGVVFTGTWVWTAKNYTVKFDAQGGSTVASQTVQHGNQATEPAADPTKVGYDFAGWYQEAAAENAFDFTTSITSDTTVYAKWAKIHTVYFFTDGGSEVYDKQEIIDGNKATKPNDPTKVNNTFDGWFADNSFQTPFNFDDPITKRTDIFAKWTAKYNIEVKEISRDMDKYNSATGDYEHVFGVYKKGTDELLTDVNGDILFLKLVNGGLPTNPETISTIPVTNGKFTLSGNIFDPNDITQHYERKEWTFINIDPYIHVPEGPTSKQLKTSIRIQLPYRYEVGFDLQDGSEVSKQWVAKGNTVAKPTPDPARDGYTFEGWYRDPEGSQEFDFTNTLINKNWTIYAKWKKAPKRGAYFKLLNIDETLRNSTDGNYKQEFGIYYMVDHDPTVLTDELVTDLTHVLIQKLTLDGAGNEVESWVTYQLTNGKFVVEGNIYDPDDITTHHHHTYNPAKYNKYSLDFKIPEGPSNQAHGTAIDIWSIRRQKLTLNFQDGRPNEESWFVYNTAIPKPVDPTRAGYTFDGWYREAECLNKFNYGGWVSKDTTLYAKWIAINYTVKFDAQGGSTVASQTVQHGNQATEPAADPTRVGFTFAGWYKEAAATNVFDFTVSITANTTVYAKWTETKPITTPTITEPTTTESTTAEEEFYYVTYVGGTDAKDVPVDNSQYRSGDKVTILGPPAREGYEFLGWRKNPLLQPGDVIAVANANIVLTAEWEKAETETTPIGILTSTTPIQKTTASTTKKAEPLVKTGEYLGRNFLLGGKSILVAVILLFLRKYSKKEER